MLMQCWALFTLKWMLFRRSWSKRQFWGYVFLSLLLFLGAALSMILSVVFYAVALYASRKESPVALLFVLNSAIGIYLFFYVWGILMDLQRADLVDFRKMLLLPISLPMVYLLNFLVSIVSPIMLFAIPALIGLLAGLYPRYGLSVFVVGLPLALLFMVMMSAWAYYLRGRLAIIMENKRRRRMALIILPLCFVALGQLPAVLSHAALQSDSQVFSAETLDAAMPTLLFINTAIPVFWPAYGLWTFMQGAFIAPAAAAALGLSLCALLGLRFGYVSTLHHYMGLYHDTQAPRAHKEVPRQHIVTEPLTARRLPMLAEDTSALTLAFYHSFVRHPHIRMLLIMPLCLGLFFLFMYRAGAYNGFLVGDGGWMPMATLVWPFFNFSLFMFNIFGVDAQSFHGMMLLPTPRYKLLLAKNLALAPFVLGMALFFVAAGALLVWASPRTVLLALILAGHLYLFFCAVGNFLSIWFPYGINRDALRLPTWRLRMLLVGMASTVLVAVMITPASLCMLLDRTYAVQSGVGKQYAGVGMGLILLGVSLMAYIYSVIHLGDQFTAREANMYARISGDRE